MGRASSCVRKDLAKDSSVILRLYVIAEFLAYASK